MTAATTKGERVQDNIMRIKSESILFFIYALPSWHLHCAWDGICFATMGHHGISQVALEEH